MAEFGDKELQNNQSPETQILSPEPKLRYTLHLLDLRKTLTKPDGTKLNWLDLPKEVKPFNTATEMTDNVRGAIKEYVGPNITELFFGENARIPSFKNFSQEEMVTALVDNQPAKVLEGVSGQRREVLLSAAAGVVNRIETYITRKVLEDASPEQLEKLGLTSDLRDLTVKLLKVSTRLNPLFTRFLAWGQKSPSPPNSTTVTEFIMNDSKYTQTSLFPKETMHFSKALQEIANENAPWLNHTDAGQFKDYLLVLGEYYAEKDPKKAFELRSKALQRYGELMKKDFPVFVIPPTEGYYKEPYDDPDTRIAIAAPEAKAEEPIFKKAQAVFAESLGEIGVEQFKERVKQKVSRVTVVLGMHGLNLLFDAAAQENPEVMLYTNQQQRTYDRDFPEYVEKLFGRMDIPRGEFELMSRMMVMLHEYGHPVFPDGSLESERMGRKQVTVIDEVKAENLFRAVLPTIIAKGGFEGSISATREQWAKALIAQSFQNILTESSDSVYYRAAAFSLNDLFEKNLVSVENGLIKINDVDGYFDVARTNTLEILKLYQDKATTSSKSDRFIKERCSPNKKLAEVLRNTIP